MKKIFMAIALCLICAVNGFGQFTCKTIDNGFDEPFKKAFCYSSSNSPDKGVLCFEEDIRWPFMYIVGSYFCDDDFIVNIAFDNGNKYNVIGEKSDNSKLVYLSAPTIRQEYDSLGLPIYNPSIGSKNTLLWDDLFEDIKKCSTIKIRINESHCGTNVYYFNLKGSSVFVKKILLILGWRYAMINI